MCFPTKQLPSFLLVIKKKNNKFFQNLPVGIKPPFWSLKSQKIFQNLPVGIKYRDFNDQQQILGFKAPFFVVIELKPHHNFGSFFHLAGEVRLHVLDQAVNSCGWDGWDPQWPSGVGRCWVVTVTNRVLFVKKKKPLGLQKKTVHHALKS